MIFTREQRIKQMIQLGQLLHKPRGSTATRRHYSVHFSASPVSFRILSKDQGQFSLDDIRAADRLGQSFELHKNFQLTSCVTLKPLRFA